MESKDALKLFEKRNRGLRNNPCCQDIPERIKRQSTEIERNEIAIKAINEIIEREENKQLELKELNKMIGEPVYLVTKDGSFWGIYDCRLEMGLDYYDQMVYHYSFNDKSYKEKEFKAYRYEVNNKGE